MDQDTFNTFKKELDNDIYTHKETMKRILHDIGWQPTKITSVEMGQCPINRHHRVPLSSLKKHISSCSTQNSPIMTTQEKLEAYERALTSSALSKVQDNQLLITNTTQPTKKKETESLLEELERQRDLKRRRVAYRKRGTHTGRKSCTEVFCINILAQFCC